MYLPTTHQHMTADEFAALPEGPPYFQLVEGELYFMATLTGLHQDIVLNIAFWIKAHLRAHPGLGKVRVAPSDVRFDDSNVFEPDVYFVSRERSHILTIPGASGAPDLIVEVLSPSTVRLDREKKRRLYFHFGVREIWFVLPERRRLEVYMPDTEAGRADAFRRANPDDGPPARLVRPHGGTLRLAARPIRVLTATLHQPVGAGGFHEAELPVQPVGVRRRQHEAAQSLQVGMREDRVQQTLR